MISFSGLFFSFRGRINRSLFWVGLLAIIGAGFTGYHLFKFVFTKVTAQYPIDPVLKSQITDGLPIVASLLALLAAWTLIVKRLHDRGKSAWLLVLFAAMAVASASWLGLLPIDWLPKPDLPEVALRAIGIVGGLGVAWLMVEILLIPSRPGANRYGPDPLL